MPTSDKVARSEKMRSSGSLRTHFNSEIQFVSATHIEQSLGESVVLSSGLCVHLDLYLCSFGPVCAVCWPIAVCVYCADPLNIRRGVLLI